MDLTFNLVTFWTNSTCMNSHYYYDVFVTFDIKWGITLKLLLKEITWCLNHVHTSFCSKLKVVYISSYVVMFINFYKNVKYNIHQLLSQHSSEQGIHFRETLTLSTSQCTCCCIHNIASWLASKILMLLEVQEQQLLSYSHNLHSSYLDKFYVLCVHCLCWLYALQAPRCLCEQPWNKHYYHVRSLVLSYTITLKYLAIYWSSANFTHKKIFNALLISGNVIHVFQAAIFLYAETIGLILKSYGIYFTISFIATQIGI